MIILNGSRACLITLLLLNGISNGAIGAETSPSPLPESVQEISRPGDLAIKIIRAEASDSDPWFKYQTRPEIANGQRLYPEDILNLAVSMRAKPGTNVPWSFKAKPEGPKKIFSLASVVPDRIYDDATGKTYVKMYHGTTSNFFDEFANKSLRFDVGKGALGTGFYLTADVNEAKRYSCERLKTRKKGEDMQGMLLVYGVEIPSSANIMGQYSPNKQISNDATGEALDLEILFKRNHKLENQFAFFKEPYIKLFDIVLLPSKFGMSATFDDADGITDQQVKSSKNRVATCNF